MRGKLPVKLENLELPNDNYEWLDKKKSMSYGYVRVMYLISLLITLGSILVVIFLGSR